MNDKQSRQQALEILKAATRDARRGGFRLFRSRDEKFVARELDKIRNAKTVIEQHRRAEILASSADWMAKKYAKGAPVRAFLHRLGLRDKQLAAIEALRAEAQAVRERAAPTVRKIEAAAGWFPKTIAKEANEIAKAPAQLRAYATRYANEVEAAGGNPQQLRQVMATLAAAERSKDAASIAEAVLVCRDAIEAHERRAALAAGDVSPLLDRGGMSAEIARDEAAEALRDRAAALEAVAAAADREGDHAKRDAIQRAMVELRTAAQQLRDARTPDEAEAARRRAAGAAVAATRAEGGEVIALDNNRTAGAKVGKASDMGAERAAELARIARAGAASLADRMRRLEDGLRRAAQRGIEPEGHALAASLGRLREQLGEAVKRDDDRETAGAWLAATSAADRDERTVSVADAVAGVGQNHEQGHEVSR